MPELTIVSYLFVYKANMEAELPESHGSMIRGTLGNVLRESFCTVKGNKSCETCSRKGYCLYTKLFYGLNSEMIPGKLTAFKLPNPYVIKPLSNGITRFKKGDALRVQLNVIGESMVQYAPYYMMAMKEFENRTLGKGGRFSLVSVTDLVSGKPVDILQCRLTKLMPKMKVIGEAEVYSGRLTIELRTPLRLMVKGKLVSEFDFTDLMKAVCRRAGLLKEAYEGGSKLADEINDVLEETDHVKLVDSRLKWRSVERYSSYKNQKMSIGGVIGTMTFEGDFNLSMGLMALAGEVHCGKASTMGDGWIEYSKEASQ